ncbi:MAG: hypothetical protein GY723_01570 [bacterium]|nr:hypothetical protein [bacterium]
MKNRSNFARVASLLLLAATVSVSGACHDASYVLDPAWDDLDGPFRLTFALDGSFQARHGGQPIEIAVLRDGVLIAQASGTVSATRNPSFSFAAGAVLERGVAHQVHYWIDSNIGGGTQGVCDPKAIDHQWSTEFPWPTNDVNYTVSYQLPLTEDVCDTFN